MIEKINLKEIKPCEIKGLLSEILFTDGICVLEFHKDYFFDNCTHGKNYKIVNEEDVTIIFTDEDVTDTDYPIVVKYHTVYNTTDIDIIADYITQDMFERYRLAQLVGCLALD